MDSSSSYDTCILLLTSSNIEHGLHLKVATARVFTSHIIIQNLDKGSLIRKFVGVRLHCRVMPILGQEHLIPLNTWQR